MERSLWAFVSLLVLASPAAAQFPGDPAAAEIRTDDLDRFWTAFDQRGALGSASAFQSLYLDPGSPGVQAFVPDRIRSAEALAETVSEYEPFYESIRDRTLQVRGLEDDIRAGLVAMERLYPESAFPPVYFVIGRVTSGGHATEAGLIVGTELFATTAETPFDVLPSGVASVLRSLSFEDLPYVVIHELVHFQQREPEMAGRSLLGQALYEGVADFVCQLVAGGLASTNARTRQFGEAHEREIWTEFRSAMAGTDFSRWLYNQGRGTEEWPADVGYYVGYKIAESYYERSSDPRAAVAAMLRISDPEGFLEQSGYGAGLDP